MLYTAAESWILGIRDFRVSEFMLLAGKFLFLPQVGR